MAWPPPVLPINRTNATPQLDTHAADHNAANQAINDLVAQVTAGPGLRRIAQVTVTQGSYSSPTVVSALSINSVPIAAGRRVQATFSIRNINGTPGNSGGTIWILMNGAQIAEHEIRWDGVGAANGQFVRAVTAPLAGGAYNFAVYANVPGGNQMTLVASATAPMTFLIEDFGAF